MTGTTALPMQPSASTLQGFGECRPIPVVANNVGSSSSSSTIANGNNNISGRGNIISTSNNNNNYSNSNSSTGTGVVGASDGRSFRVRVAQSTATSSTAPNTRAERHSRGVLEEADGVNYSGGYALQQQQEEEEQERRMVEDDVHARARPSLERTLREREKELATALQREKILTSRLRVSEETRVLYQLYTHRLLELLREQDLTRPLPLVENSDVVEALTEAIRSGENLIISEASAPTQASNIGGAFATLPTSSCARPVTPIQLTNATLLTSATLESKVGNCLLHLKRESARQQENMMQTLQRASDTYLEEMGAKLAVLSSALRRVEQRVAEHMATTTVTLQRHVRLTQSRGACIEQQQQELQRLQQECVLYQRERQRTQAEMTALKDELRRLDGEREAALIMHRAAECLEEVRQSVRNAVRGAAHAIEQSALESNTLKEPFIQSIRVIAVKVEAHADMARAAVRRWQQEYHSTPQHALTTGVDLNAVHRFLLTPPRRATRSCEPPPLLHRDDSVGNSNLTMLEELTRVMKNLCRLLENNARQMDANTVKVTRSIEDWEKAIVRKMTEIWEFMRVELFEHGVLSTSSTQPRRLCGETPLVIGDQYTDVSTTAAYINTSSGNSQQNGNSGSNRASALPLSQTNYTRFTTVAAAPSKTAMGCNGSSSTLCDHTCPMSGTPSYTSSVSGSMTVSAVPSVAPSWHIPTTVLSEVERTPNVRSRREKDFHSPPSITVSRAPTPPPPSQTMRTVTHLLPQRDRAGDTSPCNVPSLESGASTVPKLHYTREREAVESNAARGFCGAILPRRTQAPS